MPDYYSLLGVEPDASDEELKQAYRQFALRHHPDRNADDPEAQARFREVAEAYAVLSDPIRRWQYDHFGTGTLGPPAAQQQQPPPPPWWQRAHIPWSIAAAALVVLLIAGGYFLFDASSDAYESYDALASTPEHGASADPAFSGSAAASAPLQAASLRTTVSEGDAFMQRGDSLLALFSETREPRYLRSAARLYTQANQAYVEAVLLAPDDDVLTRKTQQAAESARTALLIEPLPGDSAATGADSSAAEAIPGMQDLLLAVYTQQGDLLLEQRDLRGAQRRYRMALRARPGDTYARRRLRETTAALRQRQQREAAMPRAAALPPRLLEAAPLLSQRIPAGTRADQRMQDGAHLYPAVDPQPVGGTERLLGQVRYPEVCAPQDSASRTVVARFVVTDEGTTRNPAIIRGQGDGCDDEVLRALSEARFEPGHNGEQAVDAWMTMPFVFDAE